LIVHRAAPDRYPAPAPEWRDHRLCDVARAYLDGARHPDPWALSKHELAMAFLRAGVDSWTPVASRASSYHTIHDLPALLDTAGRTLFLAAYGDAPRTFAPWTSPLLVTDFKSIVVVQPVWPQLLEVPEHAEYVRGGPLGAAAPLRLAKYGRILAYSREAVLADDLVSFAALQDSLGAAAAAIESDATYDLLTSNPTMPDGQPLFSAAHGNLMPAAALAADSLAAASSALAAQTAHGTPLHLTARFLIVGPALGQQARALVTSTTPPNATADSGVIEVVQDPRIPGTDWYLAADPRARATIAVAHLASAPEPELLARDDWDHDGREYKARDTFGCAVIDWRSMVYTPGAP
jgi:hypothetical protein